MIIEEKLSARHVLSYVATIICMFVLLQWHDNYTADRIAEIDAQKVKVVDCGPWQAENKRIARREP